MDDDRRKRSLSVGGGGGQGTRQVSPPRPAGAAGGQPIDPSSLIMAPEGAMDGGGGVGPVRTRSRSMSTGDQHTGITVTGTALTLARKSPLRHAAVPPGKPPLMLVTGTALPLADDDVAMAEAVRSRPATHGLSPTARPAPYPLPSPRSNAQTPTRVSPRRVASQPDKSPMAAITVKMVHGLCTYLSYTLYYVHFIPRLYPVPVHGSV